MLKNRVREGPDERQSVNHPVPAALLPDTGMLAAGTRRSNGISKFPNWRGRLDGGGGSGHNAAMNTALCIICTIIR